MNRDSLQKLRLDLRLVRRRGWTSEAELERELEKLPDAAHKAISLGEAADEREAAHESAKRGRGEPSTAS
jgi:hypothetical protein